MTTQRSHKLISVRIIRVTHAEHGGIENRHPVEVEPDILVFPVEIVVSRKIILDLLKAKSNLFTRFSFAIMKPDHFPTSDGLYC